MPEFCRKLKVGDIFFVWVANEERLLDSKEDYFVAKKDEKGVQLDEAGIYGDVSYKKNDWIVSVCWSVFAPTKTNEKGDRFYRKGFTQWIPCGPIIRCLKKQINLPWVGQYYKLTKALNDHIEDHGDGQLQS